jgi:hypothetical protein
VEPVRVKLYGLIWHTRRRYLVHSIMGLGAVVGVLIVWWLGWPRLRHNLELFDLPTHMAVTVAVLNQVPWIMLVAVTIKAFEMWIVLRRFAQKEAERLANSTKTSPS